MVRVSNYELEDSFTSLLGDLNQISKNDAGVFRDQESIQVEVEALAAAIAKARLNIAIAKTRRELQQLVAQQAELENYLSDLLRQRQSTDGA